MIVVLERIRPVGDEYAKALTQSIVREGLMNPIMERYIPNALKKGIISLLLVHTDYVLLRSWAIVGLMPLSWKPVRKVPHS